MSMFKKATRRQAKLKLALIGPSGSGKTYSALSIAKHMGQRIAVIDSERGSASLYAGEVADFDVLELESFAPRNYVNAIKAAEREGYDVIVVDSLTHAWSGKDGALEMVDRAAKRSQAGNSYTAWRDVTPEHNALVDALVSCSCHLIATMRVKTEYVLEEDARGKKVPKKVGLAPIQRDGLDFEFSLVADMNLEHDMIVTKSRCSAFDGAIINRPGKQVAEGLLAWLASGDAPAAKPSPVKLVEPATQAAANTQHQPANPALSPADEIRMLVETDLDRCGTREQLVTWARCLLSIEAPSGAKHDAWKAFEAKALLVDPQASPKDLVKSAKGAA